MYWRRQNDPQQAVQIMQEIINLRPDEILWLVETGNVVADSGDLEGALEYFRKAIDREPANPAWKRELVNFCLRNNYLVRSVGLPVAREYVMLDSESSQSMDVMGSLMLALKDTLSARRYFERALQVDPGNASVHLHLGQLFLQENDAGQAQTQLLIAFQAAAPLSDTAALAGRLLDKYFPGTLPAAP
jgi:tetratricopeptide (TPR) repeat protein